MTDPTIQRIERLLRSPWTLLALVAATAGPAALVLWLLFPLYRPLLSEQFSFSMIIMAVLLLLMLNATALCILAERKVAGFTQDRYGPNRVGFWGLLQWVADGLKMLLKEDIVPANVDRPLFVLAPGLALVVALLGFVIIPWAGEVHWPWMPAGQTVSTQIVSLNVGFLYLVAVGSMGVYAVVLAGYASNNKYSFYGGMRAAAQMLSYEVPLGLALLVVLLVSGSLRLEEIVRQQAASGVWYVFTQPVAFLLVLIAAFAETNRAPFDLAEAEQELVGGYHTEYSALKFGLFFLGEYAHMITNSALMIALFFGGWAPLPFLSWYSEGAGGQVDPTWWNVGWLAMLIKFGVYLAKITVFIAFYMVIRWTLPRLRFDQLMRLAWQSLVPIGVALVAATALLAGAGLERKWWAALGVNVLVVLVVLWRAARSRHPVTGRQDDLPAVTVSSE